MGVFIKFVPELMQGIAGVSYIGRPKDRTMMYLAKKIEKQIVHLSNASGCLVFVQDNIELPLEMTEKHTFILCKNPALLYAEAAMQLKEREDNFYRKKNIRNENGYWIGENVAIGKDTFIEPGVFIDHDVQIGSRVIIKTGACIRRNTRIGNECTLSENCIIGEAAFNLAKTPNGGKIEIPCFGNVVLGNRVYVGPGAVISRGSADETIIEDEVKIAALVHVGHDVRLQRGCEVRAGASISGYCDVGRGSIIAVNAALKNRVAIKENCLIGIGSVVLRNVKQEGTYFGSPAVKVF